MRAFLFGAALLVLTACASSGGANCNGDAPNMAGVWSGTISLINSQILRALTMTIDQNQTCVDGRWTSFDSFGNTTGYGNIDGKLTAAGAYNGSLHSTEPGVPCRDIDADGSLEGNQFTADIVVVNCAATDYGKINAERQ